MGRERHGVSAGGGDNEPVCGIAVKRWGQRVEGVDHLDTERQYRNHPLIGSARKPFGKGQGQFEPPFGVQYLGFPEADGGKEQFAVLRLCVKRIPLGAR